MEWSCKLKFIKLPPRHPSSAGARGIVGGERCMWELLGSWRKQEYGVDFSLMRILGRGAVIFPHSSLKDCVNHSASCSPGKLAMLRGEVYCCPGGQGVVLGLRRLQFSFWPCHWLSEIPWETHLLAAGLYSLISRIKMMIPSCSI